MSLKELAARWNVSCKTARQWLKPFEKEIGRKVGYLYSPHQVKVILSKLE